jgi:hypothetical protein
MRRFIQGFFGGGLVRAGRQINLNVFANVNAGDTRVTHVGKGVLDGFALRIKDGFFRSNDDFGFHVCAHSFRLQVSGFKFEVKASQYPDDKNPRKPQVNMGFHKCRPAHTSNIDFSGGCGIVCE